MNVFIVVCQAKKIEFLALHLYKKVNMVRWAVVETYYKYGEYKLHIFDNEDYLWNFVLEKLRSYEYEPDPDTDMKELIELV